MKHSEIKKYYDKSHSNRGAKICIYTKLCDCNIGKASKHVISKGVGPYYTEGGYILFFIQSGANLAHHFP